MATADELPLPRQASNSSLPGRDTQATSKACTSSQTISTAAWC